MRKLLVRLLNLVYIAAAGVALYALCTRPMLNASITLNFSKEQMGTLLGGVLNKNNESSESEGEGEGEEVRLAYRESQNIKDYVTAEKIQDYFPNGYKVTIPVQIPVTSAFNLNNTHLLDDLIQNNLHKIVDNVVETVIDPLHSMFKDIFKGFAKNTLTNEINKQIAEKFPGAEMASEEEIDQVFDNVYALLDSDEPVTVDTLAETILHGDEEGKGGVLEIINSRGHKYVLFDPQPTEEQVEADRTAEGDNQTYFVSYLTYTHNTGAYNAENAYFQKTGDDTYELFDPQPTEEQVEADRTAEAGAEVYYIAKVAYKHNTEPYDSSVQYYDEQPYTDSDIDEQKITDEMVKALEDADGLVTLVPRVCDPQPTEEQVTADIAIENEKDRVYYILDGEGNPVLPTAYDANTTYYFVDKVVNDIDSAVNALISNFLGGNSSDSGESRAIVREEVKEAEDKDSLETTIKDYLYKMIPENITEKSGKVGEKAPYIFLAIVAIFALPWAWFILVTLLRTFRKHKCYTRLGIVIWGALLQVVLGLLLTYGTKYLWPAIAGRVEALKDYANSINFDVRTGCLIPSFVWLGFAITAIPYWLFRRPLKYRANQIKSYDRRARVLRKKDRYINSVER